MLCSLALALAGCSSTSNPPVETPPATDLPPQQANTTSRIKYVFVIAMENRSASEIHGSSSAPYLNGTIIPNYGYATQYQDDLPSLPSEPHLVWMEAGTNAFSDHTFTNDDDPSARNSTGSTEHLSTQIRTATNGVSWLSYQEDLNATTGGCPVVSSGFYAAKHNPFVFFRDVSGSPPSKTNSYCAAHHKPYTALASDLASKAVATYNFITPNLCHDMHGASGCPDSDTTQAGDAWLQENLPPLISFVNANNGVIFIVWDEAGESGGTMPFFVIGPEVKPHFGNPVVLSHSSLVKSLEQILNLPILPTVSSANDFSGFFNPGMYP
jgi:phosphatidylinositol-3-phosphatase